MPNDCENRLCVRLLNSDAQASDLEWWFELNAGIKTVKLPTSARHAFLMGASNASVPRLAVDFPKSAQQLSRDLHRHIFDLAATKVAPSNFKPRSGQSEDLSFIYATPSFREDNPDWQDWNSRHWGTKWDCYGTQVTQPTSKERCLTYEFFTAWGPPLVWLEAAAKHWHEHAVVNKRVMLDGLSREDLNGKRGLAIEYVATKERYLIHLDGAELGKQPLGVRRANLRLIEPSLVGGGRDLPSYSLELRYAECGCGFSGLTRWEGTRLTEEAHGDYGEYLGEAFPWEDEEEYDEAEGEDSEEEAEEEQAEEAEEAEERREGALVEAVLSGI